MPDPFSREQMRSELSRDEGRRRSVYRDSLGYFTIGVGYLVDARKGGGLPEHIIDALLDYSIDRTYSDIKDEAWFLACDTDNRRRALINMSFQLGPKLRGFVVSLDAIMRQDWATAGRCLRKSLWYRQTTDRAERIIKMLENG